MANKKATKQGPAEKDRFGSRMGTKQAQVNAMLSRKPITMKEIKEAVGGTFYNHLNGLIAKKKVKKTAEGYSLRLNTKKRKH